VIDRGKRNLLGVLVDAVDMEAAVERILAAARERRPFAASATAVHGLMTGALDPIHARRLNRLDLVAPDGQPVRWALNRLHRCRLAERVYGPTLMLELCARAARESLSIYLFGSREEVLEPLARRLSRAHPGLVVAGRRASAFRALSAEEHDALGQEIRASGAAVVFVGLGCPRQEIWAYEQREAVGVPLVAVGAAFDFHAGLRAQAPAPLQRAGLEWAYRLAQEPRRLWRRYLLLNPIFLGLLALQWSGLRVPPAAVDPPPPKTLRCG
jgi:exopolysaccharide biosynthesis WecB/TagA/CpsF family protein